MEYKFIKLSGKSLGICCAEHIRWERVRARGIAARPVMTGFNRRLVKSCHNGIILDDGWLYCMALERPKRASGSRRPRVARVFYKREWRPRVSIPRLEASCHDTRAFEPIARRRHRRAISCHFASHSVTRISFSHRGTRLLAERDCSYLFQFEIREVVSLLL